MKIMKDVVCSLLLLSFLLMLFGCSGKTTFKTFSSREGGFSVEIPVLPTEKKSMLETQFGTLVERDYFSIHDGVSYTVGYIIIPDDLYDELKKSSRPIELLNINGLVSHTKGRLLAAREVSAEGRHNYGKEVLISLPDGKHNLVSRIIWSGKTVYLIHTIIPKTPSYNQDIYSSRFLNSLRIIGVEG